MKKLLSISLHSRQYPTTLIKKIPVVCYTVSMQLITEIFTVFIMGYIGLTNTWAGYIETWFIPTEEPAEIIEKTKEITELPVTTNTSPFLMVPDILRSNASYQQAALQAAITPNTPTNNALNAIVNIFCTSTTRSHIRTTTGTGFFVHSNGVILTNAHVAQYLLLTHTDTLGNTECVVRTGNPASPQYEVDILYISPTWIVNNASFINEVAPTGTGERDYALLYVTRSVDESPLPLTFPALATDTSLIPRTLTGHTVYVTGYPAEALIAGGASTNLIPRHARTSITDLFTFGTNYADVLALSGSNVGEHGASGGPVTTSQNSAIGMIATKGDDTIDGTGSLRAITLSYIDRTIQEETGFSLASTMSGDLSFRAKIFTDIMVPFLTQIIITENNRR
jgi:S1-C subfamily serine protease